MKKVWKWVIGIVVVLVIVAALAAGAFLRCAHFANVVNIGRTDRPYVQVPGDGWRWGGAPERFPGMMPFGNDDWCWRGMHLRGHGMMGFGLMPFGGIIGGLFSLGLLALVVLGIIWLVGGIRTPAAVSAPAVPVEQAASAAPISMVHSCSRCGEPVQEGWKHCPNCGKKQ